MSIHEKNDKLRDDNEFLPGNIKYLVPGNLCRLLDGRRTSGIIEDYFEDSAMFRWRILEFEDKGKYWDIPAENIVNYQFEINSQTLNDRQIRNVQTKIRKYKKVIIVKGKTSNRIETEKLIEYTKTSIIEWLKKESEFFKANKTLDFSLGSDLLAMDLKRYMELNNLKSEEMQTAELMVLNPNSGEWIKGLQIVMAKMGLVQYHGKAPRTKEIFKAIGNKRNREKYIITRLAFIRAYFSLLNIDEVILYRGMSCEGQWKDISRTLLPCTFSYEVAQEFSDFKKDSRFKISYLIKLNCSVKQLFMTFLETSQMNNQYQEKEAIILYENSISI